MHPSPFLGWFTMLLFDIYPSETKPTRPMMLYQAFKFNPLCRTACFSVKERFDLAPIGVSDSLPFSVWIRPWEFYETLAEV